MPEVCLPPPKRLCIAFGPRYEVRESSSTPAARPTGGFKVDYGFVATLDREIRAPVTDETKLGHRMTNLVTTVRQDTNEIYRRLDEASEARAVLSGRLNLLGRDTRSHAYTALLMEREARLSLLAQQTEIAALRAADRARQAQLVETLRLISHVLYFLVIEENGTKKNHQSHLADTTATTYMTNAQLKAMIDQGVIDALAAHNADRNTNGDDSHNSGTGVRRT
ncbi:hypothetical protein Tco_1135453 [Tanacetum coccineum]